MRKTLAEAGEVPQQLLDDLGIRDEWLQRYPHELSGGELQRFCIARALATRPRYLICDEVSTMLDAVTQAHIWHVLLDYAARENAGMLLVSHTPALTERVATRKRLPIHQHLTGLRALKPGEHAAQRGFAEPRGRLQRHTLARFHLQVESAVQGLCAGIPERDVSGL